MQRMWVGRAEDKRPPRKSFVTKPAWMQGKGEGSGDRIASRKEKLEKRADAAGPGVFVVLGVGDQFEMQVAVGLPATGDERITEGVDVIHGADAFFGAGVEPDARAGRQRSFGDETEDGALVPPDRRRQDGKFAEDVRIFQAEVDGEQAAQGRAAESGAGGRGPGPILAFDEGF